ncbi:O-antigen ligase family protein [Xenorhabdus bovienii]|uniref:O-antigen ligase family protein n=1 Tax=Xenorhabdus bovienii TaxID=40576 RepID=UPI00237CA391|nr:O-antigen ligase family protein [Xenorhabdus bovienii]MDE1489876.1 O-antigen ligase family protein [Xenorhabdus bovienii]
MKHYTKPIEKNFKEKYSLKDLIIYTYALLAPLSTTFFDRYNLILISILFLFSFLLKSSLSSYNYKKNKIAIYFIFSYFIIFMLGIFGYIPIISKIIHNDKILNIISRVFTISICIITIFVVSDWAEKQKNEKLLFFLKVSFFSTLIFAIFGIYQILSHKYNLPFLETRSNVYGTSYEIQQELSFRLTSIAREPNFYSPILFESILISFIVLNRKLFIVFSLLSLYLIFRTYSTGVYIHTAMMLFLALIFLRIKIRYKLTILIIISIMAFVWIINNLHNDFYYYFLEKLNSERNGESYRVLVYLTVLNSILDSNIINFLIGHGINSLQNFSEITETQKLVDVSVSNNLYLDILWESGILGIFSFLIGMFFIGYTIISVKNKNNYRYISFMLFLSFLITSLYRSEYTTTHFTWVFCNIIILYVLAKKK